MKIILASVSPRRHALLEQIGLSHEVEASDVDEIIDESLDEQQVAAMLAMQKAVAVAKKHKDEDCIIIGADTIVVLDNCILGKPESHDDAKKMLKKLQGKSHFVLTGIALIRPKDGLIVSDCIKTKVTFRTMREEEIKAYIHTQEPMDKAGAYGIQGFGSKFIEQIEGDFFNVVGLPLCRLTALLEERFGYFF